MANKKNTMNLSEYARHAGVSPTQVSKWVNNGSLGKAVDQIGKRAYSIDVKLADEIRSKNRDPQQDYRNVGKRGPDKKRKITVDDIESKQLLINEAGEVAELDYLEARTFNERYKAAKSKIDYEKEIKTLINAEAATKKSFEIARQVRDAILAISNRCASLVAAESDQFRCKKILDKEIKYILENLSNAIENI